MRLVGSAATMLQRERMGHSLRGSVAAKAGRGEGRDQWPVLGFEVIAPGLGFRGGRGPHREGLCLRGFRPRWCPIVELVNEAQPSRYIPPGGFVSIRVVISRVSIRRVRVSAI